MRARFKTSCLPWLVTGFLLMAPPGALQAQSGGNSPFSGALPGLGDGGEMTLSEERRIGDTIARSIYRDPDYLDDPALLDYLDTLWQPLLTSAQARGEIPTDLQQRLAWQLFLVRDRSVNAFALPGGYLGVHLGLIATVSHADELASVLAHELSHVSQRHIARLLSRQSQQTPWMIAAMIMGALAASKAQNVDIASAAIAGGQAMALQNQLNFSRDMEREADRVGFGVMTQAGFNGQGFVTMFDKLQQASRLNDDGAFPYLRSHPLTSERIADMHARMPLDGSGALPTQSRQATPTTTGWHAMMAARARVLAETHIDRLRALAQTGRQNHAPLRDPTTLGSRYAATLAAAQLRDVSTAELHLNRLLASQPEHPNEQQAIRWLALETMLLTQTSRLAGLNLAALRDEVLQQPQRTALLLGARAALASRDTPSIQRALQNLQTWVSLHPQDASAWQSLAGLAQNQQQAVRAARAEAEARYAQLDLQGALDRLKSAQTLARQNLLSDHVELSILDARTREVQRQLHEQFCEDRDRKDMACHRTP